MIRPPALQPGNTMGIVAPGRKIDKAVLKAAAQILETWKISVRLGKNVFAEGHSYFSGTDEARLNDFQEMIRDSSIHAIIAARGGYGTTRILDRIDLTPLIQKPKWIIGFSDLTALHLKLAKVGVESIHGTMPVLFSKSDSKFSLESLRSVLSGEKVELIGKPDKLNRPGSTRAQVIGGNLSLILDSLGTPTEPDTSGKILVLEEIDEYLYKIDRMLTQLKRAGKLQHLAGMVVGHFTDTKETEQPFGVSVKEIIYERVSTYTYPVAFNFPVGHENPNLAWRHGGEAYLDVSSNGSRLSQD